MTENAEVDRLKRRLKLEPRQKNLWATSGSGNLPSA